MVDVFLVVLRLVLVILGSIMNNFLPICNETQNISYFEYLNHKTTPVPLPVICKESSALRFVDCKMCSSSRENQTLKYFFTTLL